ncbi:hypothetical protein H4R18_003836 [Coemansia javaensis]|uniref:Uncharacterized protein n=1 Tax=Coemansia javaensis TaxID=2761396 RepID=A0A9W8H5W0_9FUNG|nr:hypothetical protein H4R18_003836 [Coemansia javaensis]
MGISTRLASIEATAHRYEVQQYTRWVPLAQHPFLQLFPIVGNLVVFVQTVLLVRRVNRLVDIPLGERVDTWASVCILLFVGMVPVLGLWLTMQCEHCSYHIAIAKRLLAAQAAQLDPADIEECLAAAAAADHDGTASYVAAADEMVKPSSSRSHRKPSSSRSHVSSIKRAITSAAGSKKAAKEEAEAEAGAGAEAGAKAEAKAKAAAAEYGGNGDDGRAGDAARKFSVFNRVSRAPWMEAVLRSPTDSNRQSLSVSAAFSRMGSNNRPQYTTLHDLATRNSRLPGRPSVYATDDLLLAVGAKHALAASMLIDDGALDCRASSGLAQYPRLV